MRANCSSKTFLLIPLFFLLNQNYFFGKEKRNEDSTKSKAIVKSNKKLSALKISGLNNNVTVNSRGKTSSGVGEAISFDVLNSYLSISDNASFNVSEFTIETWFKWQATGGGTDFICSKGGAIMEIHTNDNNNSLRFIPVPGLYLDSAPNSISQNTWIHLACVYKPSAGIAKMYINGIEMTLSQSGSNSINTPITANSNPLIIGSRVPNAYPFLGKLDEFRVWNRALSQEEIQYTMNCEIPSIADGLIVNHHFNQGIADGDNTAISVLTDSSGYSNNATLVNFNMIGTSSNLVSSGAVTSGASCTVSAPLANNQSFCAGTTVASLVATGSHLKWYNVPSGGLPLASNVVLNTGNYYVSQTIYGIESSRTLVSVDLNISTTPKPAGNLSQIFVTGYTLANLTITGNNIKWYDAVTGGNLLATSTALVDGAVYYASQTIGTCESLRVPIKVHKIGENAQEFCLSDTPKVSNLSSTPASGASMSWYNVATGGTALPATANLSTNTYYAQQTTPGSSSEVAGGFKYPAGVAIDNSGNYYVADASNFLIKKLNPAGTVIASFTAESNGYGPYGIAVDGLGNIYYCADKSLFKMNASGGGLTTLYTGTQAFSKFAIDRFGNIYISDFYNNKIIKMDNSGGNVSILSSDLYQPYAIALDTSGNIYITDYTNNAVKKMDSSGNNLITLGSGFNKPTGIAVDAMGNIYVLEASWPSGLVKKMNASGENITVIGSGFEYPTSIAIDNLGAYYITVESTKNLQKIIEANVSNRAQVSVVLQNSPPSTTSLQVFSSAATVANLVATGTDIKWYDVATGGTALASTTSLSSGFYYVTQTVNGCESTRTKVTVDFNGPAAALSFDGADDYVAIPNSPSFNVNAFTIETWVKRDRSGALEFICSKGSSIMEIQTNANNSLRFIPVDGLYLDGTPNSIPTDTWFHVACVYNPSIGLVKMYINGVENAATISGYSSATTPISLNTAPFGIGRRIGVGYPFKGKIDDFRLWSRALSQTEIQNNMNCEIAGSQNGLFVNLHLNDGFGEANNAAIASVVDASGNNNNGALTNFAMIGNASNMVTLGAVTSGVNCNTVLTVASPQTFCNGATISSLVALGTGIKWYDAPTGGTPLSPTVLLATGKYYVSQTINGTESERTAVNVEIMAVTPPPTASAQTLCSTSTVSAIQATGIDLKWYNVATGGTPLAGTTPLVAGTYYVSQTLNGCESARTSVDVTLEVTPLPSASDQSFNYSATVANLVATGTTLKWYSSLTGGTPLSSTASLASGTYYVSQTINACESARKAVNITIQGAALSFDGVDDYLSIANNSTFNVNAFTIETWVKCDRSGTIEFISSKGSSIMEIHTLPNNSLRFLPIPNLYFDAPANSITIGAWTHVACVYNPSNSLAKMYINGTEVTLTQSGSAPINTPIVANTAPLGIGARIGVGYYFMGKIDEFRVWNRALTQAEIQAKMNCEIIATDNSLIINQHFNQGFGEGDNTAIPSITDNSGNNNNGTLTNFSMKGAISNIVSIGAIANGVSCNSVLTAESSQSFCTGATVSSLVAIGANLKWYDVSSGGTPLAGSTPLITGNYYVSQTLNGTESERIAVNVTVFITPPPTASAQTICNTLKVADLVATGTALKWYTAATGGIPLQPTAALVEGTYYVSQTLNGCESTRTPVSVTLTATPAPTASAQTFKTGATVANLLATGSNLKWYDVANAGTPLLPTTVLVTGTYYVSQTIDGCESTRTAVNIGLLGAALSFDGFNDYLSIPNNTSFNVNAFTIETWIKCDYTSAVKFICAKGLDNMQILTLPSNSFRFSPLPNVNIDGSANAFVPGTWVHLACVYDPSRNVAKMYINGSEISLAESSTPPFNSPMVANTAPFEIGARFGEYPFLGKLDEFRVWNRALSQSEIQAKMNCEIETTDYGLIVNQHFNQGIGEGDNAAITAITDSSGANNNGTLLNFAKNGAASNIVSTGAVTSGATCNLTLTAASPQTFYCSGKISDLVAIGTNIKWYDVATNGTPLTGNTALTPGDYYVSQTVNGIESARIMVNVVINVPAPPTASAQTICSTSTLSALEATGTNLKWYNVAAGGTPLAETTTIAAGTYYVSQTVDGCESARTAVSVTLNVTPMPAASAQTFNTFTTVANLVATGTNLQWYNTLTGGTPLAPTKRLSNSGMLYVSQTVNGCESARTSVNISILGASLSFDGVNDYVAIADNATFNVNAFTIEAWVKCDRSGAIEFISSKGSSIMEIQTNPNNSLRFIPVEGVYLDGTPNSITPETWTHVACVYDPSTSLAKMYINGEEVTLALSGYNPITTPIASNTAPFGIGSRIGIGYPFMGKIDEFRVWKRALSQAEIKAKMNCEISNLNDDLIVNLHFNQGIGEENNTTITTITDASGNSNNGVLTNFTMNGEVSNLVSTGGVTRGLNCEGTITVDTAQTFCNGATVASLVATGINIKWYDVATGGSALTPTTVLKTGNYYVSQTINGTESERITVNVTVNTTPEPTALAQTLCSILTVADLVATGNDLKWYDSATGGTALLPTTVLREGTYYVSQTLNSCESTRTPVRVTLTTTSAPNAVAQSFNSGATIADLVATGTNLKWYSVATGGTPLSSNTILLNRNYYATQTLDGCESARTVVAVTVTTVVPIVSDQIVCEGTTISNLVATGSNLSWYNVSSGGTPLEGSTLVISGKYYVSQTISGTESDKVVVNITVNPAGLIPTGLALQVYAGTGTLNNLSVTGNNIKWYDAPTAGNLLENTTPLVDGATYYASQTTSTCESSRLAVKVQKINESKQFICNSGTVADLVSTPSAGASVSWFDRAIGGSALSNTNTVSTGTYFVEQMNPLSVTTIDSGFNRPYGVAVDASGLIYVADYLNHSIKKVNAAGTVLATYSTGNVAPQLVLVDASGNIYYAETTDVYKMNSSGSNIVNLTGYISYISDIALDSIGNLYVSDYFGNAVLKVNTNSGNTVTFASGFTYPLAISLDSNGNLFVVEEGNNKPVLKINSTGNLVNTIGSGFSNVSGLAVDTVGNIYVSEKYSGIIKKMNATGSNITVLIGADNFSSPQGIAVDSLGNVFVAVYSYKIIQKITQATPSNRVAVNVEVTTTPPPVASAQTFNAGATVANLIATGSALQWYNVATGGAPLAPSTELVSGTYYVSQTLNGCPSERVAVSITINPVNATALRLDGVDDYVAIPDNASLNVNAFTIETWFKWDNISATEFIFSRGSSMMEVHTNPNNSLRFIPVAGVYLDSAPNSITPGVWTHLACVYDPSTSLAKMYINGQEVSLTISGSNPITTPIPTISAAFVMGTRLGDGYNFKGRLDEFRLWNRALSQAEIQNNKNCEIATTSCGLIANLHFNQGIGEADNTAITSITDVSGINNHARLNNFALTGTTSNLVSVGAVTNGVYCAPLLPTGNTMQIVPSNSTLANLMVSPSNVLWYATESDALARRNALPTTTYLTDGATYYAAIPFSSSCSSEALAVTVTFSGTLGSNDFKTRNFEYYPNPVKNILTIINDTEISKVYFYNLLGQEVFSRTVNAKEAKINISGLPTAVYVIKIVMLDGIKTLKIIKE